MHKRAPADPWVLTCNDPTQSEPAYIGNGRIGFRIGRDGSGVHDGFLLSGWTTESTEELRPLASPLETDLSSAGKSLFDSPRDYVQSLDMRTGLLRTFWTTPGGCRIQCEEFVLPTLDLVEQRWRFHVVGEGWGVREVIDGTRWNLSQADHVESSQEGSTSGSKDYNSPYDFPYQERSNGLEPDPLSGFEEGIDHALQLGSRTEGDISFPEGPLDSYEKILAQNNAAWKKRWQTDIEIDGPVEDQQAVRSWMFYLWCSVPADSDVPVGPMGSSSTLYKGHQFWDADIWMFPALALFAPGQAKTIANYRLSHFRGTPYPWESSVSGNDVGPPEFKKAVHITGDVAFMLHQAMDLGLADPSKADAVGRAAAKYYAGISVVGDSKAALSQRTPQRSALKDREILQVKGPDEYHVSDNDLYTNTLAQWLEDRFGEGAQPPAKGQHTRHKTQDIARQSEIGNRKSKITYKLPHDGQGLVAYDGDPVRNYGQADAELAIYPIQNKEAEAQAQQIMNRIAPKINPTSPAMSDSVDALIWARLGNTDQAYTLWRRSWQDFMNHPLCLFSEERRNDRTYFVTGAAGCLQTVLYGFLGFRIDLQKDPKALWAKRLRGGDWLTLNPHLPRQWKKVTFRNFYLLGQRYTLTVTHNGINVTQGESL